MVSVGISCPFEMEKKRVELGISPSKAYQLGLRIYFEGGMDALEEKFKIVPNLQQDIAIKDEKIAMLENKIELMKTELTFTQNKIVELEDAAHYESKEQGEKE